MAAVWVDVGTILPDLGGSVDGEGMGAAIANTPATDED
jgi:hypothetical protein